MKKTSVYLTDAEVERLADLAHQERRPQAEILRDAIAQYQPKGSPDRDFAVARSGRSSDPGSIAEISEEELLKDFGSS
jgi:predicted transcriptional regulator